MADLNNSWKNHLTVKNIFIVLVVAYFVILNERKMYVNTGPDPVTVEWEKELFQMKTDVEALKNIDSIHYHKIVDYAKTIIQNDVVVDGMSDEQLDSAFAALTTNE